MKMNKLIIAAIALAGVILIQTPALAQNANLVTGDLVLSFEVNDGAGNGATQNLEVNLGLASSFNFNQSNSDITALSDLDLQDIYGNGSTNASWNGRSDLVWSIEGSISGTPRVLYVSNPGNANSVTTINTPATANNVSSIANIYGATALDNPTATNSPSTSIDVSTTDPKAAANVIHNTDLNYNNGNAYNNDYNFVPFTTEQNVSGTGSSIDLYKITNTANGIPAASVDEGTFTLSSNGVLSFTTSAVPEPSTYALFGLGALLVVIMGRRTIKA